MDSRAGPSSNPQRQSSRFPHAFVNISPPSHRYSTPTRARVAISSRIYWIDADHDEPNSLFDFRGADSLLLERLADGNCWGSVEKVVSIHEGDNGRSVVVHGTLQGPARRRALRINANVQLTLTADTADQGKRWLNEIRVRVAPPDLLYRHVQGCIGSLGPILLKDTKKCLETVLVRNDGLHIENFDQAQNQSPSRVVGSISDLQQGMDHLSLVDKAAKLAGSIATTVKMGAQKVADNAEIASRANHVAQSAQQAADITGAIAGLSCAFQLVGLGAGFVSKLAEASHCSFVLPGLLDEVVGYLGIVMTCLLEVSHSRMKPEEILIENMFQVLTRTIDAMGAIEEYLMQGKVKRTLDSTMVEEFKSGVEELKNVVASVVQTTKLLKLRVGLEMEMEQDVGELPSRPMLSPYFVGHTEELKELNAIVNKYGSAVVSQYGGIGKTQLMVKFAEDAEATLPGGAYWVTADGDVGQVLDSLATFVEKLRGTKLTKDDRKDINIVVPVLQNCLSTNNGKLLLCLDNIDNATDREVSEVLDRVCSTADPVKQNGWVVVTSRQGRSTLWDGMKKEQRMELGPLTQEDATCLLMRFANSINAADADDATIISEVNQLKGANRVEYDALLALSTILGRLPLALVQAGTYIRQFQCTSPNT